MILQPSILALLFSSTFLVLLLVYAAVFAGRILRRWDLSSGSEVQLQLERRTYLISTILAWAFGFQLLSLFLFIHTADSLAPMFVGAMCAAGTLYADPWGYPTLLLKIATFLAAGLWLVLNHADNRAWDYPLIRPKYFLLLGIAPLVLVESGIQAAYFLGLKADVITSCCGTLFSQTGKSLASELAHTPLAPTEVGFFAVLALTIGAGLLLAFRGKGGYLLSLLSVAAFASGAAALISFISIYYYELPTHHCPFCVLQAGYGHVGYALYVTLLAGAVTGIGTGVLQPFRRKASLAGVLPVIRRRLALACCISYGAFGLLAAGRMIFTDFRP